MLKPFEEQEKLRSHRTKKSNPKHLHCFKEKVAAHPNNVLHTRRIADGTNKIYPLPPMLTHSALSTLRTSRIDAQSYRIEQKKKKKKITIINFPTALLSARAPHTILQGNVRNRAECHIEAVRHQLCGQVSAPPAAGPVLLERDQPRDRGTDAVCRLGPRRQAAGRPRDALGDRAHTGAVSSNWGGGAAFAVNSVCPI